LQQVKTNRSQEWYHQVCDYAKKLMRARHEIKDDEYTEPEPATTKKPVVEVDPIIEILDE